MTAGGFTNSTKSLASLQGLGGSFVDPFPHALRTHTMNRMLKCPGQKENEMKCENRPGKLVTYMTSAPEVTAVQQMMTTRPSRFQPNCRHPSSLGEYNIDRSVENTATAITPQQPPPKCTALYGGIYSACSGQNHVRNPSTAQNPYVM